LSSDLSKERSLQEGSPVAQSRALEVCHLPLYQTLKEVQHCRAAKKHLYLVSVNFFSDIHIPASLLFEGSTL
jgi:hypothetical protein